MKSTGMFEALAFCLMLVLTLQSLAQAEVVLTPLRAEAKRGPNLIANPGFEDLAGDKPAKWDSQLSPKWGVDTAAHSGKAALRLAKPNAETRFWVAQNVQLNQTKPTPLVLSGWSKADQVSGTKGGDYSVWVDLQYMDGTPLWGQKIAFDVGTHDWQRLELPFVVAKPVRSATVSILFRGAYTGTVWFDDLSLQEMQIEGGAVFDRAAVALQTPPQSSPPATAATAATDDGLALGFAEDGGLSALSVKGKSVLGATPGGFWLRDVAADGPWLRPACRTSAEGKAVTLTGQDADSGLGLDARCESTPTGLDFVASLQDTTGKDRAMTAYFVLPLPPGKWTWHDDIARSMVTAPGAEYFNAQSWPAAGLSSTYPYCSLTNDDLGLSLAVPMDCPRVCRFVYNSQLNVLYVAFDLGLTKETLNFPSRADFRFSIFQHDPAWGFRAATQKYYTRHPQFFEQRLKRGGIWMAFSNISKVAGWEDFGFAYDEHSATPLEFDNAHDIASFSYVEPMTYHLSMDKKYPRTYEGVMQALAADEASGQPAKVGWARLTKRCGACTKDGRLDLVMENASWCDGAVFTLNPDPNIPEDKDCPANQGHRGYNKAWADKNLLPRQGPRLDGIYIDSMPNWGEVRNFRREHWRTVTVPLTFDPETRQPVLLQIFSTWQFSKWVADDVHARGGVMHGNGGALWPFFPALLDITGQETGGVLSDQAMAQARTLLRNKPYSPLMNTRFDKLGAQVAVEYFNKSLLYCIFPSFFDGDYMVAGKWQNSRYFESPQFYERERPLYKQYIPILRRMFDAGWEPVTYARAEPAALRVERYGPRDSGEVLLAVYNPGNAAATATLTVDAAALALKPGIAATALVSGAELACARTGNALTVKLPLAAGTCEVLRLGK